MDPRVPQKRTSILFTGPLSRLAGKFPQVYTQAQLFQSASHDAPGSRARYFRGGSPLEYDLEMRTLVVVPTLFILITAGAQAADVKAGQAAYDKSCKSCHGADGTPNPGMVKALKVDMRDLKSPEVQAESDDQIKKIITTGMGKMRPVTSVTGDSVNDVVAYIRTLKK